MRAYVFVSFVAIRTDVYIETPAIKIGSKHPISTTNAGSFYAGSSERGRSRTPAALKGSSAELDEGKKEVLPHIQPSPFAVQRETTYSMPSPSSMAPTSSFITQQQLYAEDTRKLPLVQQLKLRDDQLNEFGMFFEFGP